MHLWTSSEPLITYYLLLITYYLLLITYYLLVGVRKIITKHNNNEA
jgi:hypothetical protein